MISPWVRRRRLAAELVGLREDYGYSGARLAEAVGIARQTISRLENGHARPNPDEVMRILDVLQVGKQRWSTIMTIARDAQERGWWEKHAGKMGPRQALYANLEAGAASICEYQMMLLPGLLQIPTFAEARAHADRSTYNGNVDPVRAVEAGITRQRVLQRPGGPRYEVIIDELAVRRFAAPADTVLAQIDHLVHTGHHDKKITIRVLPLTASINGFAVPRSAFSVYRYPDPEDPVVVVVDTTTSDLVLTDAAQVNHYLDLYRRLREAATAPADSLDFLAMAAEDLNNKTGS